MYSTALLIRIAKIFSVFAIGIMALLIVIGNTTDYCTNYLFIEHVMKMDTTFPSSNVHYRHINNSLLFHAAYIFIISIELIMAFCCLKGSLILFRNLRADAITFHASKNWAVMGIITGLFVWFFGFEVIGGEWFAMWQSASWNGLGSAERIVSFLMLVLISLQLKEESISK
jgi:predicted small integral membrane protein